MKVHRQILADSVHLSHPSNDGVDNLLTPLPLRGRRRLCPHGNGIGFRRAQYHPSQAWQEWSEFILGAVTELLDVTREKSSKNCWTRHRELHRAQQSYKCMYRYFSSLCK